MGNMATVNLLTGIGHNNFKRVEQALKDGADINAIMPSDLTPLVLAIKCGHVKMASYLLEMGANPNTYLPGGTALHYAVRLNYPALVEELFEYGADNMPVDAGWKTPLDISIAHEKNACIRVLIQHGASLPSPMSVHDILSAEASAGSDAENSESEEAKQDRYRDLEELILQRHGIAPQTTEPDAATLTQELLDIVDRMGAELEQLKKLTTGMGDLRLEGSDKGAKASDITFTYSEMLDRAKAQQAEDQAKLSSGNAYH